MVSGTDSYTYLYDGNGNVGQMLNSSTGAIEAHYEYDPYGNSVLESGALASSNPYRFSTKYFDSEYGLYYYGYRYLDPETGRWLNRDPIEENGGLNLYSFALNEPINIFDLLGMQNSPPNLGKIPYPSNQEDLEAWTAQC
ncbi:MAG: RHS repeat-associated core domain-containing protein [Candidatus Omnitrophica bacterium]|nr:RHS repeat-associated core domain-containing protein [Candidatus Omnitrophota bacterium]